MYKVIQMTNEDIPRVEAFLNARKDTTLFALGNIEQYGLEKEYVCYSWIDGDDEIAACVFNFSHKYATAVLSENLPEFLLAEIRAFILKLEHEDISSFDIYFDTLEMAEYYSDIKDIHVAKTNHGFVLDCQEIPDVTFHVLTAENDDLNQLSVALTHVEDFQRFDVEVNKEIYRRSLERDYTLYAKLNGEPVGAASVTSVSKTTAVVTNVWVLPEARNRGIARQLIHRVQSEFLNGERTMYIMYADGSTASRIYLNNGFTRCGKGYIAGK